MALSESSRSCPAKLSDARPPTSSLRRTASRIPLAVAAKRTFRRRTKTSAGHSPARARKLALTAPASSRRSPLWCAGSAPSARFRVGVHRDASRASEPVLRSAAADSRPPTPGAARPQTILRSGCRESRARGPRVDRSQPRYQPRVGRAHRATRPAGVPPPGWPRGSSWRDGR